MTNKTGPS